MSEGLYLERTLQDFLSAERQMRALAESGLRDYNQILQDLAVRLDGKRLDALRGSDPTAPLNWRPLQWRLFWNEYLTPPAHSSGWNSLGQIAGSGEGAGERLRQENKDLLSRVEGLKLQLDEVTIRAREAENRVSELRKDKEILAQQLRDAREVTRKAAAAVPGAAGVKKNAAVEAPAFADVIEDLREVALHLPEMSPKIQSRLGAGVSGERLRRQVLALYLIARYGISVRLILDGLLAIAESVGTQTHSVRAALEGLAEEKLVEVQTLRIDAPFSTSLALARLTEEGRAIYGTLFSAQALESDWERVIRLHQGDRAQMEAHTVGLMAFWMHARLRGWHVRLLPEVAGAASPDAMIEREEVAWYVEVERAEKEDDGAERKWRNLAALQGGKVAVCAFDVPGRQRQVEFCTRLGLTGVAADLQSLIFSEPGKPNPIWSIRPDHALWLESW